MSESQAADRIAAELVARAERDPRLLKALIHRLRARGHLREILDAEHRDGEREGQKRGYWQGQAAAARAHPEALPQAPQAARAEAFLYRVLEDDEVEAAEVYRLAESEGIAPRTLQRVATHGGCLDPPRRIVETKWRVVDGRRASFWRLAS